MIRHWALHGDHFMPSKVGLEVQWWKKRTGSMRGNGSVVHFRVCCYWTHGSEACCKLADCDRMLMWCNTRCWRYKQACNCKVVAKKAFTLLCYYCYYLTHLYLDFLQSLIKIIAGKEGYVCLHVQSSNGKLYHLACLLHKTLISHIVSGLQS